MPFPTHRRFPRTMAEAFPQPEPFLDGPYSRRLWRRVVDALCWVAAVTLLLAMVFAPQLIDKF